MIPLGGQLIPKKRRRSVKLCYKNVIYQKNISIYYSQGDFFCIQSSLFPDSTHLNIYFYKISQRNFAKLHNICFLLDYFISTFICRIILFVTNIFNSFKKRKMTIYNIKWIALSYLIF